MTDSKEKPDKQQEVESGKASSKSANPFEIVRLSEDIVLPSGRTTTVLEMTAREESQLRQLDQLRTGKALESVYNSCTEGLTEEELLSLSRGDRTFLIVKIRSLSYGVKYDFDVRCPSCGGTSPKTVDLSALEVLEPKPTASPDLVLERTGWRVTVRELNGHDEHKLSNYQRKSREDLIAYELFLMLKTVNGKSRDTLTVDILKKLPAKDSLAIREAVRAISIGVDTGLEIVCTHCTYEWLGQIPITADFFFPDKV